MISLPSTEGKKIQIKFASAYLVCPEKYHWQQYAINIITSGKIQAAVAIPTALYRL
jgi:hypothetical protein